MQNQHDGAGGVAPPPPPGPSTRLGDLEVLGMVPATAYSQRCL